MVPRKTWLPTGLLKSCCNRSQHAYVGHSCEWGRTGRQPRIQCQIPQFYIKRVSRRARFGYLLTDKRSKNDASARPGVCPCCAGLLWLAPFLPAIVTDGIARTPMHSARLGQWRGQYTCHVEGATIINGGRQITGTVHARWANQNPFGLVRIWAFVCMLSDKCRAVRERPLLAFA